MNMSNYTQHLKSKKMYTLQLGTIYTNHNSFSPGGPIPHNLAWALMPRQPYSEAVPSTEKVRLHPRFLRKRGLGRKWIPLWLKRDGVIRKNPHSSDDKCRAILQWGTKITFFKKLIGVTTCNIVGTLYW